MPSNEKKKHPLDIEPSYIPDTEETFAMIDKQRAEMISRAAMAEAMSLTVRNPDDSTTHWALYVTEEGHREEIEGFLMIVVMRAMRDAATMMKTDYESVARLAITGISMGLGE